MKIISLLVGIAALTTAGPAFAGQLENLNTPYPTRGACESANAGFSNEIRDSLLDNFPNFFASEGEVASFLTRAFPCELNASDGQWYIKDHRLQVLTSDWYLRRQ